jgi:glycosyltransferase involved in cell wall biosynthesis
MGLRQLFKKILGFFLAINSTHTTPIKKARIVGVSMVKNEADIIELFIKINSRFFSEIHILDHYSSDHTATIIKKFQADGYPIKYKLLENDGSGFNQAEITANYIRQVARDIECDYIMPIDADEFPFINPAEKITQVLSEATQACGYCLIPWVTYCPIKGDYLSSTAPLYTNFRPRNFEPDQYYKIILTRDFARTVKLATGNHNVIESEKYKPKKIKAILQHVPVRSAEQISSKAIIGSATLKITKNHKAGESFHWDEMAERILARNMEISEAETLDIALNYAKQKKHQRSPKISIFSFSPKIGTSSDTIELKDLAKVDIHKNINAFRALQTKTS